MKHCLGIVLALSLADCGGKSSPAPIAPPPPPFSIGISPSAAWLIVPAGSRGTAPALANGAFDFPVCSDPTTCWIGYVEYAMQANLSTSAAVTIEYTIAGDNPVFSKATNPNNTCPEPPAISLVLYGSWNDSLNGRWFSLPPQSLALGTHQYTVSLHDLAQWTSIFPPPTAGNFSARLANIEGVGFAFGGGCYSAHGVAVTSGSARFTLNSYTVR